MNGATITAIAILLIPLSIGLALLGGGVRKEPMVARALDRLVLGLVVIAVMWLVKYAMG